jgi:hypothetical protein
MTALNLIRSLAMAALFAAATLGQSISQASGSNLTGVVTVNTTAPADYTSVKIEICDKDGNVLFTDTKKPGEALSFEVTTIGTDLKVYATFTKPGGTNIQGPKDVTWR